MGKKTNLAELKNEIKKIKERSLEDIAENIANANEWHDIKTSPLSKEISAKEAREEYKKVVKKVLNDEEEQKRISRGLVFIDQNLHRVSNEAFCREELKNAANLISSDILELTELYANNPEKAKEFEKAVTPSSDSNSEITEQIDYSKFSSDSQYGLSESTLISFYDIGTLLFDESKIEEARCVFQFLGTIDPFCYEVWISLGLCHQKLNDLFAAYTAYLVATGINARNPLPYVYMTECFLSAQDKNQAFDCLELAEYFNREQKNEVIQNHIEILKIQLNK